MSFGFVGTTAAAAVVLREAGPFVGDSVPRWALIGAAGACVTATLVPGSDFPTVTTGAGSGLIPSSVGPDGKIVAAGFELAGSADAGSMATTPVITVSVPSGSSRHTAAAG